MEHKEHKYFKNIQENNNYDDCNEKHNVLKVLIITTYYSSL